MNIIEMSFPVVSLTIPLNLQLVRSHQAEIFIVKQGRNNMSDEGGSWT